MANAKCRMQNAKLRSIALFAFCILHSAFAAAQPLHVGTITIHSVDVYSPTEAGKGRFYRAADALHIETHDSVIRKFLLFREGDEYRPERLLGTGGPLSPVAFF